MENSKKLRNIYLKRAKKNLKRLIFYFFLHFNQIIAIFNKKNKIFTSRLSPIFVDHFFIFFLWYFFTNLVVFRRLVFHPLLWETWDFIDKIWAKKCKKNFIILLFLIFCFLLFPVFSYNELLFFVLYPYN